MSLVDWQQVAEQQFKENEVILQRIIRLQRVMFEIIYSEDEEISEQVKKRLVDVIFETRQ